MFREMDMNEFESKISVFSMFNDEWSLITAGDQKKINTMTASWGGLGIMWSMKVATVYIRQSRYTMEFVDSQDYFTVSFFGKKYRKELGLLGSKSGRDCDKIKNAGFTPVFVENAPTFEQAELVLVCRKLYKQQMELSCILDPSIEKDNYSTGDLHHMYLGEIKKVFVKE
ncbi:MAG: flavin reductase [Clostridiales bacterium]|nr:flavin reductase [Clostridiales bacterium]